MELMGCPDLAVPPDVMHHVVSVESSFNPYAIGVVGGRLARQPVNLPEAIATAQMLESRGYNFSLGLAQVNRYNLSRYGLQSYEQAFRACPNLQAGARILAECHGRSGHDWGKSFSCYYSGNFTAGFRAGYVQKIYASMRRTGVASNPNAIPVYGAPSRRTVITPRYPVHAAPVGRLVAARVYPPAAAAGASPASQSLSMSMQGAPASADLNGAVQEGVVVLRPNGLAPRLAGDIQRPGAAAVPPAAAQDQPTSPRDSAFVF